MVLEVFGGDPVVGIRHLVRRWCPATHTFFLAWGEFTVTIEYVANLLMLPILGDIDPTRLRLTAVESVIEEELIEGFGGKGASFGGHLAKHSTWVTTFRRRSNKSEKHTRHAAFVAFWLTKFVFFASVINMSLLQACLWEHLKEYRSKCRKLKDVAAKFEKMPSVIANKSVGFRQGFPIIFKWFGAKGLAGLMDSLDKGTGFTWRPYSNLVSGFASRSLLLLMHGFAIGASGLREGDMTRISYLASVKAGWLPAWSPQGIKYVAYCTHRVTRQFWFDQDIPGSNLEVLVKVGACTKRIHDYWARIMGIFVEYVRGGTQSDIPMPGLCIEPPSNFRILRNVASRNGYGSRQGVGYVEWHEEKSSWKVFGTHLPQEWASTHSTFIEDEGGRSKKGKRVAEVSPVAPIDPSKEGKKKARVHVVPTTSSPITSTNVLAMSKPVSPSTVVTRGSARRMRSQSKLVIAPIGKDEKGSRDLPINLSVGDKSPSGGKETSAKAVKAFAGDVDAVVDVGNALAEEGGLADPARGELIVEGGTAGIDLDIDLVGNDGVETARAYIELPPIVGVETRNDSIRDDASIVPPHTSPATHDSLGIERALSCKPATIASRPTEELSRPFNFDDYFVGLGAFLDTMRSSCVGLPMTRDKLIAHAAPTSEGDPYDDVDDNLVVREVLAPFSGEMVDTSSSFGDGVEVSPARGDDLDLTLRVPYSRLREGSMRTMAGEGTSASLPLPARRVGLSEGSTISATEGLTQFLEDLTKEIYNDHSPRHFLGFLGELCFKFGYGSGSFYLHLLSGMLCDMRRTPLELVTEGKLQDWRRVARELIDLGFAVDFLSGKDP
uniref:Aminotransferase-like plant mobile domain-containing protein n=1 Tax=Fagus sylvatica TaxID=28930 RepID=A0A2N9EWP7_FAGSY